MQKRIAGEIWGSPDAVDAVKAYTPMNPAKARMARWSILRKELHDSLSLCNWMGPWVASPLRERGYRGDDSIESLLYGLVTGRKTSREELDRMAERIFLLHRALTIRGMGTKHMRSRHDTVPDWVFEDATGKPAFAKGTQRMDRDDIARAMDLYYEEMGWDTRTGAPTKEAYERAGLSDVAKDLEAKSLLP